MTEICLRSHDRNGHRRARVRHCRGGRWVPEARGPRHRRQSGRWGAGYAVEFLNGREVVNDSLGGGPVTATWW